MEQKDVVKRREDALRESEERFRKVFDFAAIGMALVAPDGKWLEVNQALCNLVGYTAEELLKIDFQTITHPDDLDADLNLVQQVLAGDIANYHLEKRYLHKRGHIIWILLSVSLVHDDHGQPLYFIAQVQDISARKSAECDLVEFSRRREEALALLDALQKEAPIGLGFVDLDFRFVRCNEALAEINGQSVADHLGRKVEEVAPQTWRQIEPIYRQALAGSGAVVNREISGETASQPGTLRHWIGQFYPVKLGDELLGIGIILSEITVLKRTVAALQVSEARSKAILSALPDRMFRLNSAGTILDYYPSQPDDLFVTATDVRGTRLQDMLPRDAAQTFEMRLFEGHLQQALETQQLQVFEFEIRGRTQEPQAFEARLVICRPDEVILVLRNITEQKHMESRLLQKQKLDAIGQLASGVAHDFNNLLTVINGNCHLLGASLEPNDPRLNLAQAIQSAGTQAAKLTRQLLMFSRGIRLQPESINVNEVIEQSAVLWRQMVGATIDVVLDLAPQLWQVLVDRSQMEQVLLNLVVNARDAMPSGGQLLITTRNLEASQLSPGYSRSCGAADHGEKPQFIQIAVSDTGVGMSAEVLARIYEPFFTTKEVGQGSGLGLPTCHGIVRQSGGWIEASSEPGRGSTFRILFPSWLGITHRHQAAATPAELATLAPR